MLLCDRMLDMEPTAVRFDSSIIDNSQKAKKSSASSSASLIQQPTDADVLCGKDKTFGRHPGNQKFRLMIDDFVSVYEKSHSKQEKMQITRQIVAEMKARHNTRFIKKVEVASTSTNNDSSKNFAWQEISDSIARDKVSHALRFASSSKATALKKKKSVTSPDEPARKKRKRSGGAESRKRRGSTTSVNTDASSKCTVNSGSSYCGSDLSDDEDDSALAQFLFERQQRILSSMRYEPHTDEMAGSLNCDPFNSSSQNADLDMTPLPLQAFSCETPAFGATQSNCVPQQPLSMNQDFEPTPLPFDTPLPLESSRQSEVAYFNTLPSDAFNDFMDGSMMQDWV